MFTKSCQSVIGIYVDTEHNFSIGQKGASILAMMLVITVFLGCNNGNWNIEG